ncbi:P-loop containing nucleoside triphosphate hydrolase protein [Ascobolus immersus RN42]|uniref:P-loop containing nucleoside triphosphate hydrolase protein n=1 Tax=Ascobolus immersus RN42 TaxID=1160509 RepID=A0A3N4ICA5_ASCIM|nr:P-loop containing nucleoside triphosphate hydrolase protein [Ascobolus immersus RN42]
MPPPKKTSAPAPKKPQPETTAAKGSKSNTASKGGKSDPKAATGSVASKGGKSDSKAPTGKGKNGAAAPENNGPPALTAKQIIGGMSWTGKVPVQIFNEHCRKAGWDNPDYAGKNRNGKVYCVVTLSRTNPKTKEKESIQLSPSFDLDPQQPTILEARHWAATFALHRVASGKNLRMILPPTYREVWDSLQTFKEQEVKVGLGWKYSDDPFTAKAEQDAAKAAKEKARQKFQDDKGPSSKVSGPSQGRSQGQSSGRSGPKNMEGWRQLPVVELSATMREEVEKIVRTHHSWNPLNIKMSPEQRQATIDHLKGLGFRQSHSEEACDWSADREEALQWLLIHVPEDDLPSRFLPDGYSVGVTISANLPLQLQYAAKRLAACGYDSTECLQVLEYNHGDESRALEALMQMLVYGEQRVSREGDLLLDNDDIPEIWQQELETLHSIWADRYEEFSKKDIRIMLQPEKKSQYLPPKVYLRFRLPMTVTYPHCVPVMSVEWEGEPKLPAHVRLSIVRRCVLYAEEEMLVGAEMLYSIVDWLEQNIIDILQNPGKLREFFPEETKDEKKKGEKETRDILVGQSRPIQGRTRGQASKPTQMPELSATWQEEEWKRKERLEARMQLPAWKHRSEIVHALTKSQLLIIAGETGSGKSTQAVQFILDSMIQEGKAGKANIVCTQPRRISALGLAERVSYERGGLVGEEVGFAIRGESKQRKGLTKITFMTTGILLRRLQVGDRLEEVSHVVIDEVHERSLDTDILLVLMKRLMAKRPDLRVVLMSATLNAQLFNKYFDGKAAVVEIEGRTHPVTDYYLDNILEMTGFIPPTSSLPASTPESAAYSLTIKDRILALGSKGINYDLIASAVKYLDLELYRINDPGGILIFMPGVLEIKRCIDRLEKNAGAGERYWCLPLHASLTPAEQKRVFERPSRKMRKIVVATNIAETSITIDDIVAVIDSGRVKQVGFSQEQGAHQLIEKWASKAECKQRRGRAGRVRQGACWKLFTKDTEVKRMAEAPEPEIRRVPLEQTCLSVMGMGIEDPTKFLASAMTPPEMSAVQDAVTLLEKMAATKSGKLTSLGRLLAMIPADLRCAKLIIYGCIFQCLDAALTIAAVQSTRSPFLSPQDKREDAKAARESFAESKSSGDLMVIYRAYEAWQRQRLFQSPKEMRKWCNVRFLNHETLKDIGSNKAIYASSLQELGFLPLPMSMDRIPPELNRNNESEALIKALVAAAFQPQIARVHVPDQKFMAVASGTVAVDPEARLVKFFTESERVFLHPSSILFSTQSFSDDMLFVSYVQKAQTGVQSNSGALKGANGTTYAPKFYLRDITPISALPLVLFGSNVEIDPAGRGILVNGWLRIRGWGRIGVLLDRLKWLIDGILKDKVDKPGWVLERDAQDIIDVMVKLLQFNGR